MRTLELKPTHKPVQSCYTALRQFDDLRFSHEGAVKTAFHGLLGHCARQFDWKLDPEYAIKRKGQADAKADGALLDNYRLIHGLWEPRTPPPTSTRKSKTHALSVSFYAASARTPEKLFHVRTSLQKH